MAEYLKWPKEHWTLLLQSIVVGKAREIYSPLTVGQSSYYDNAKELILYVYKLVVVALLFYVHGKHLRSCRDGQLT